MQALLFGMPKLNIFPIDLAAESIDYLERHSANWSLAGRGSRLVFGSPKNRDRGQLDDQTAHKQAIEVFRQLADTAAELGVVFCLEPNPVAYQCNFMTNTDKALSVVSAVDHPGLGLHLDSGILCLNGESPEAAIESAGTWLKHFHVSEPQLAPVDGHGPVDHPAMRDVSRTWL